MAHPVDDKLLSGSPIATISSNNLLSKPIMYTLEPGMDHWLWMVHLFQNWPILYGSRRTVARIFQLNGNKSETAQDIDLKFSVFVHHMSGLN